LNPPWCTESLKSRRRIKGDLAPPLLSRANGLFQRRFSGDSAKSECSAIEVSRLSPLSIIQRRRRDSSRHSLGEDNSRTRRGHVSLSDFTHYVSISLSLSLSLFTSLIVRKLRSVLRETATDALCV